jgi:hypothetical protein
MTSSLERQLYWVRIGCYSFINFSSSRINILTAILSEMKKMKYKVLDLFKHYKFVIGRVYQRLFEKFKNLNIKIWQLKPIFETLNDFK